MGDFITGFVFRARRRAGTAKFKIRPLGPETGRYPARLESLAFGGHFALSANSEQIATSAITPATTIMVVLVSIP